MNRPVPALATWILKLFCAGPEHEPAIGDLFEQYQQGRSPVWYWRQVVNIVVFGNYRKAGRLVMTAGRIPIKEILGLTLMMAVFTVIAQSDMAPVFIGAIIVGAIFGILRFQQGPNRKPASMPERSEALPVIARINMSRIGVHGGLGTGLLILFLMAALLHDLYVLRVLALPGLVGGVIFAIGLRLWGKGHVPAPRVMSLGLIDDSKSKP